MEKGNTTTSSTIDALRTILCMQIVFYHMATTAPVQQETLATGTLPGYIITFITMLNNIAVPLFFAISGYLFCSTYTNSYHCYLSKIKKRTVRLLQPILIWTSIYLLLYYTAEQIPLTATLFSGNNDQVSNFDWLNFVNAYTGLISGFPFAGQYWFLRNLFLLCVFFPLFWLLFKYTKAVGFILFCLCCYSLRFINLYIADSLFTFTLGAYVAFNKGIIPYVSRNRHIFVYAFLALTPIVYIGFTFPVYKLLYSCLFYPFVLSGFVVMISIVHALLPTNIGKRVTQLAAGSFFVFLIHQQLQMIVKRVIYKFLPIEYAYEVLIVYLIVPIIVITVSYLFFNFLKKKAPRVLNVMIGKQALI